MHESPTQRGRTSFALASAICSVLCSGVLACAAQPKSAEEPVAPGAASALPAGAAPAATDPITQPATASVFVIHQIGDLEGFKKYFEEGASERVKMGIRGHLLSRLDDGRVLVHFIAKSLEEVQAALDSERMQSYLNRAGAPDSSLVWLTHDELVKLPATAPTGQTFSLVLKLKVKDFEALKRGFAERAPVFAEQGVLAYGLHRSSTRPEIALLHFVGDARDKLTALTQRPEFLELLTRAGNEEPVVPLVGVDVSRSRAN